MLADAAFIYRRADIAGPMDRRDMSAAGTDVIAGKPAGSGVNVRPAENGASAEIGANIANGETVATIDGNENGPSPNREGLFVWVRLEFLATIFNA